MTGSNETTLFFICPVKTFDQSLTKPLHVNENTSLSLDVESINATLTTEMENSALDYDNNEH